MHTSLPVQRRLRTSLSSDRGYTTHVGYLGGAESYDQAHLSSHDFWHDDRPANASLLAEVWYSTNYYTTRAVELISDHDVTVPLYMDLRYQGVHGPYVEPPVWEQVANSSSNSFLCGPMYPCQVMESMVSVVDNGIANVTQASNLVHTHARGLTHARAREHTHSCMQGA